ncbi:glycolipid transfer protein 3-like [Salvia hispanica]|uniref:glycolipid transfer protein 3-like n=1 Tax=Salvia hispanica TaxID=49212 RepID=UPI002009180A|nr:glycolipid transfer protein 3-like [Salvia hispanica]
MVAVAQMKRRREVEMVASEIRSAIDEVSLLVANLKTAASDHAVPLPVSDSVAPVHTSVQIPIKPFLSLCDLLVQVLDKIGPTMAVLRQDIRHNIERLEKFHDSDPSIYCDVVEILKKEVNEGNAKKGPTCSKAFVWLNRSLDFAMVLLELLVKDFGRNMEEMVEESYTTTLKPWHGWISAAAYKIALKLVPDSRTFVDVLKVKGEEEEDDDDVLKKDIQKLISLLMPVLEQNKDILREYGLDKLKST